MSRLTNDRVYTVNATAAAGSPAELRAKHTGVIEAILAAADGAYEVTTNQIRPHTDDLAVWLTLDRMYAAGQGTWDEKTFLKAYADVKHAIAACYGTAISKKVITPIEWTGSTDKTNSTGNRARRYSINYQNAERYLANMDLYLPNPPSVPKPRTKGIRVAEQRHDENTAASGLPITYASQRTSTSVDTTAGPSERIWTGQVLPTLSEDECSLF